VPYTYPQVYYSLFLYDGGSQKIVQKYSKLDVSKSI
jgi:hypothetical protein